MTARHVSKTRAPVVSSVAAVIVLVVIAYAWLPGREPEEPALVGVPSTRDAASTRSLGRPNPSLPSLPHSLAGTSEDGALLIDEAGQFVPSPDAIDLFDYYLSAVGEEDLRQIRERILAAIHRQLEGPSVDAAIRLLDDYLRYRDEAADLLSRGLIGEDLDRRLQYFRELRREVFGAEIARLLFGEEEERWFIVLEQRRIVLDSALSEMERAERLRALDAGRPAEEVAARESATAHARLRNDEADLLGQGAYPEEIRRLRIERFGEEAEGRLEALDSERADWQRRLGDYRVERDVLVGTIPKEELSQQIAELRTRHFAGREGELLRIRAIDRMDGIPQL